MSERLPMHHDAQAILARVLESGEPLMETLPVLDARKSADDRVLRGTFPRREGVAVSDRIASAQGLAVPLRIYRPLAADSAPLPIVIYYHGGGMVVGSIETVDAHCRWLCLEVDCVVVSVGYRLAPEFKFPAGVDDAVAAALYVQDH